MRAIIQPYNVDSVWCSRYFPEHSLCSMPIAGRSYGQHMIDAMQALGAGIVLLLDYNFDYDYMRLIYQDPPWSCKVKYRGARRCGEVRKLLTQNEYFCAGDEVLVAFGAIFPDQLDPEGVHRGLVEVREPEVTTPGLYLLKDDKVYKVALFFRKLESLRQYMALNFRLMRSPGEHLLPGYGVENGVHVGSNDIILPGAEIKAPVILGNNLLLESGSHLAGSVIIGDNVMIDRGTSLKRCVILDHSYVGQNMEFVDKIVAENRIIDPLSGAAVELEELGMAGDLRKYGRGFELMAVTEYFLSWIVALVLTPGWLLLYLPFHHWLKNSRWRWRFDFDVYPILWKVIFGHARLIGIGFSDQEYVFSYRESFSYHAKNMPDAYMNCYYRHHRSSWMVLTVTLKAMLNRLFATEDPRSYQENFNNLSQETPPEDVLGKE